MATSTPRPQSKQSRKAGTRAPTPLAPATASIPAPPLSHPAFVAAVAITAAAIVAAITFPLTDTDFWQHLAVGRAIWQLHSVPTTQIWCWPTYGAPDVNTSWGFRALLWPVWELGGVWGLFAWRWATTLAAFALLWLTSRRMGARGFGPLAVIATCAIVYRLRSQIRPETLVAVLMALEMWILETRRHGGRDCSAWLVPLAMAWANCHISYFLFFVVLGAHALDDLLGGGAPPGRAAERTPERPQGAARAWTRVFRGRAGLVATGVLCLFAMLVNPWGWRALWQPIDYFLHARHEPIMSTISELQPPRWEENTLNGMPLIVLGFPLLLLWRWSRREFDRVEIVIVGVLAGLAASSARFVGFFALGVVPYLARDLDAWLMTRRWPSWTALPALRAGAVTAVALAAGLPHELLSDAGAGVGIAWARYPVDACDFIAARGVRGRVFNTFELGGYLLYRFWPEKDRLPFIDIHQTGTRQERLLYVAARVDPRAWHFLDSRRRFDWLMLLRQPVAGDHLLDTIEADSAWALVFMDDVAVIYVRRDGPLAPLAKDAYRDLRAGENGARALGLACESDPVLRERVQVELEQVAARSHSAATTHSFLGAVAMSEGRLGDAERHLRAALATNPRLSLVHERLGDLALAAGRPLEALAEYTREQRLLEANPELGMHRAEAWRRLGRLDEVRNAYRSALRENPGNSAARDSLAVLDAAPRP